MSHHHRRLMNIDSHVSSQGHGWLLIYGILFCQILLSSVLSLIVSYSVMFMALRVSLRISGLSHAVASKLTFRIRAYLLLKSYTKYNKKN